MYTLKNCAVVSKVSSLKTVHQHLFILHLVYDHFDAINVSTCDVSGNYVHVQERFANYDESYYLNVRMEPDNFL